MDFWTQVSRLILKGRYIIILLIAACTYFLASQMQYMRFSYTEANLLPENHKINIEYNKFLELFGEEGNLIILATEDSSIFTPDKFNAWNDLSKKLDSFNEVDFTVAIGDIQKLKKNKTEQKFDVEPLYDKAPSTKEEVLKQADFVTLHVPAQKEYVISTKEFELMKNEAFLVNAARGGVVDEVALVKALEEGQISKAALDVFENEPTPEIQLLMNPSLSLTPHIGAATGEAQDRIGTELATQIIEILL